MAGSRLPRAWQTLRLTSRYHRNNHHLFQPLLYQVATAGLSPADIASPIRGILGGQRNVKIMLAEVSGIDVTRKEVIADGRRIAYDYLVLATGARHAYFGHNDWAAFAPGLKTIEQRDLSASPHPACI